MQRGGRRRGRPVSDNVQDRFRRAMRLTKSDRLSDSV